jgi:uncharacterized membrane protein (DUF373 family)
MADDAKIKGSYGSYIGHVLELTQAAIYLLAAIFLVLLAVMALFVVARDLSGILFKGATIDLIYLTLNDLLVVLIIVELIQTIVVFIQRHEIDLRLIIAAGITALIRRVLVFGVEKIPWEEMAITALLLIVLVVAIYLIGRERVPINE